MTNHQNICAAQRGRKRALLFATTMLTGSALAFPSMAAVDEIIVTANKREQSLLEVGQSITVIDTEALRDGGFQSLGDFVGQIPGVEFRASSPAEQRITIRGISSVRGSSTVGLYIDDIPFTVRSGDGSGQPVIDIVDLNRIEVLRGPQGTLYGEASMGGTIRFITNQPQLGELSGAASFTVSTTDDGERSAGGDVVANIPLGERVAVRAVVYNRHNGGWIDDITSGDEDVNSNEVFGARITGLIQFTDKINLTLRYLYSDLESDADNTVETTDVIDLDGPGPAPGVTLPGAGFATGAGRLGPSNDENRFYNARFNAELPFADLQIIGTHQTTRDRFVRPFNLTAQALGSFGQAALQSENEEITAEIRLVSNTDGMFDWVVGGFYRHNEGGGSLDARGILNVTESEREHIAVYGQGTLHLGDRFNLIGGLRYFTEDNSDFFEVSLSGLGIVLGSGSVPSETDDVTWKAGIEFMPTDNGLLYATVATGFRSGGANRDSLSTPLIPTMFEPDFLRSYEVGGKFSLMDDRVFVAGAVYYNDWNDIQVETFVPPFFTGAINGGAAHSVGVELEVDVDVTENLNIGFGGNYTQAEFDSDLPTIPDSDGNRLPWVPEVRLSGSFDYHFPVADGLEVSFNGGIDFHTDYTTEANPDTFLFFGIMQEVEDQFTARLGASISGEQWSINLFAENLTNEDNYTNKNGIVGIQQVRPRTIGVTTKVSF